MTDTHLDGARRRIRLELERRKAIAFVGWRDSFHDEFTRSIQREKVVFTDSTAPPAHVGFIFFSKRVDPTLRGRIGRGRSVWPTTLDPEEFRALLKEFASTIVPTQAQAPSTAPASIADDILEFLTHTQELGTMDKFTKAFRAEAAKNEGRVGRQVLGKLIREYKTEPAAKLVKAGWVIPEIAQHKKRVGWYRAGEQMVELERKATVLPEEPQERARFLLAQKEPLIAEQARLQGQIDAIKKRLDFIEEVAKAVGNLETLLKKA